MADDLVKRLRKWDYGKSTWTLQTAAADHIEKLEASEAGWRRICDSYAAENQRFSDRIEKLESALRDVIDNFFDSNRICEIARKALEGKDD